MRRIWWHTLVSIPRFESQNQTLKSASGDNKSVQKAIFINNHYDYKKHSVNNVFDLQRRKGKKWIITDCSKGSKFHEGHTCGKRWECLSEYSRIAPSRHLAIMDTPLIQTAAKSPGKLRTFHWNELLLLQTLATMDLWTPFSVPTAQ